MNETSLKDGNVEPACAVFTTAHVGSHAFKCAAPSCRFFPACFPLGLGLQRLSLDSIVANFPKTFASTFHRKKVPLRLPPSLILLLIFPCLGKKMFAEALASNHLDAFFILAGQYTHQTEPAFCGITVLVMVHTPSLPLLVLCFFLKRYYRY